MPSTAPSQKVHPYGTSLEISTDGGSSYTQYYDVQLITPPDEARDDADVTVLDSPNFTEEKIASWIKQGKLPFAVFYAGTGSIYNTLRGYFRDGTIRYTRLKLPLLSGQAVKAQFVFQAYISKFKLTNAKAGENNPFVCEGEMTIATDTGFAYTVAS